MVRLGLYMQLDFRDRQTIDDEDFTILSYIYEVTILL